MVSLYYQCLEEDAPGTHTCYSTYVIELVAVNVRFVCFHHGIQHEVRGKVLISSSEELVEDIEAALTLAVLRYPVLLQQKGLRWGGGGGWGR